MHTSTRHEPGPTVSVLGVPVSCLGMSETLAKLEEMIRAGTPNLIVTADATALVIARQNPDFAEILARASLVTPDSVGVLWAMERACGRTIEKVSGVDLAAKLVERSSQTGERVFLLGAAPGVAELAAEKLRLRFPGCNIVGARHGYFPPDSDGLVAQEIAEARPDVLLVAMGMPRQEQFIVATQEIIRASVAIGVGGSFDVFSGKTKRAPRLVQAAKLEWLWRLILNPRKLSKVKSLPKFVLMVLRSKG